MNNQNTFQVRVITNGYIVAYMDGTEFVELCFDDRKEFFEFLAENLAESKWEVMAHE